ncbi:MAG: VWA domain-containing protein [Ruminococcus sp.]|nr:VWA domain-containing protein [Ruminococcus sp.]
MKSKKKPLIFGLLVVIIGMVIAIIAAMTSGGGKDASGKPKTVKDVDKVLRKSVNSVTLTKNYAEKGTVTYDDSFEAVELPDINKTYPLVENPVGCDVVVEIFSSPEKAGTGTDGWMLEMAKEFNRQNNKIDGKSVGVKLRSISSGTQIDYILSGSSVPAAISPSASMWCDMLESQGIEVHTITDRTVGNVAGVLVDSSTYSDLEQKYGTVDINAIVSATLDSTLTTGYTNPLVSTTGLNFLASVLYNFDSADPLGNKAVDGFKSFQDNIPFVAYNTLQMRTAAENGTFGCMMMEYQSYIQDVTLSRNYKFVPFGIRHDNPLTAVGKLSDVEMKTLEMFADLCKSDKAKKLADEYGFNKMDDYKGDGMNINGNSWNQMQKLWKTNKNSGKPIAAVFVLDTSGSMSGAPLNSLKMSLRNSIKYINSSNYIGVVSYSSNVNVDLELAKFDLNQQAYFMGAVDSLTASGNTATFSALSQAMIMLRDFMKDNPNVSPMVFLLSDGQSNSGSEFSDIDGAIATAQIPIYTIGYNANLNELKAISEINEAATINADTDDVIYQLKNLFNANL